MRIGGFAGEGVKSPPPFKDKTKLFVALPTRGTASVDFAKSLAVSCCALTMAGVEIEIHEARNSCSVDMNRNRLVAEFLKTDCTHIWFIDDDMGWNPEAPFRMLKANKEFIAGVGPKKVDSGEEYACQINVLPDETPVVSGGLISASRVGGAFLICRRSVFEKMALEYPGLSCKAIDQMKGHRYFEFSYEEFSWKTEDYNFCDKWIKIGGEIWVFPDIDFTHTGIKDYRGNYHKFLMSQPKPENSAPVELKEEPKTIGKAPSDGDVDYSKIPDAIKIQLCLDYVKRMSLVLKGISNDSP